MASATVLEILATEQRSLSALISEIPSYEMFKTKIACPNDRKTQVMDLLVEEMKHHQKIINIDHTDGLKMYMKDGWVLMRPSGTEPIFRIYAEAKEKQQAEQMALFYKNRIASLIQRL
jgi:phosphomannomutase / phosphoglucomutase